MLEEGGGGVGSVLRGGDGKKVGILCFISVFFSKVVVVEEEGEGENVICGGITSLIEAINFSRQIP